MTNVETSTINTVTETLTYSDKTIEQLIRDNPNKKLADLFALVKGGNKLNKFEQLIKDFPDKDWEWDYLSDHKDVTCNIIRELPNKGWNWKKLSKQLYVFPLVKEFPDKDWKWYDISVNSSLDDIRANPNLPWNWCVISRSEHNLE